MTKEDTYVRKGDIFYVKLGTNKDGHIQNGGSKGIRPCIVMTNEKACMFSPVLLVVPITSSNSKRQKYMPTHLKISNPLKKESIAIFEQILTVNRYQLCGKIGCLSKKQLSEADKKIMISFGLVPRGA